MSKTFILMAVLIICLLIGFSAFISLLREIPFWRALLGVICCVVVMISGLILMVWIGEGGKLP